MPNHPTTATVSAARRWRDPASTGRLLWSAVAILLLWPMLQASEFHPWELLDAQSLAATGQFLSHFFPPACSPEFLGILLQATWQTVAIATAGISLALLAAIPMALIASEQLSVSLIGRPLAHPLARLLRHTCRLLLIVLRSVPELVWALLFVRLAGLGPTAGVIAIALTYAGMLGKVYAEILESSDAHACRSLLQNGAGRLQAFLYGSLPAAAAELTSYTIYRWECAIRGSVIMGFVGAGGLGQRMDESLKMLAGDEVSAMLLVFVLLVAAADALSNWARRWLL